MPRQTKYGAVIVGAGPAGLNAGLRLATSAGSPLSVLLIDKFTPWERPVPSPNIRREHGPLPETRVGA